MSPSKKHPTPPEAPAQAASPAPEAAAPAAADHLAEKERAAAKLREELLYERAELENFKRRTEKRYQDALRYATEPLVKDLLPVLDNLERALAHAADPAADNAALVEGVGHVLTQLREALARHGVGEIAPLGEKFDPNLHEALAQVPGAEDNKVAAVHEKGYTLHGKLVRSAKVLVSRLASPPGDG